MTTAARDLLDRLRRELEAIDQAGLYKRERLIDSPQGAVLRILLPLRPNVSSTWRP